MNGFWNHLTADGIFTTLTTITVFVLGYIFNKIYENHLEKERLNDLEDFLIHLLKNLNKPLNKKSRGLELISELIEKKEPTNFEFPIVHDLNLESFDQISRADIFKIVQNKSLESKKRNLHLSNVYSTVNYIKEMKIRSKDNFTYFKKKYDEYLDAWNSTNNKILRSFDNFKSVNQRNNIKPAQDEFLAKIDLIFHEALKNREGYDFEYDMHNLILPMKKVCQEHPADERSMHLLPLILDNSYTFKNIQGLKKTFGGYFIKESKDLKNYANKLNEAVEYLFK